MVQHRWAARIAHFFGLSRRASDKNAAGKASQADVATTPAGPHVAAQAVPTQTAIGPTSQSKSRTCKCKKARAATAEDKACRVAFKEGGRAALERGRQVFASPLAAQNFDYVRHLLATTDLPAESIIEMLGLLPAPLPWSRRFPHGAAQGLAR